MKVLMLGVYDVNSYSRGRILWKGLKANNVDVDLTLATGKAKYLTLAKRILKRNYDVLLCTGKVVLLTAWLLKPLHRKPIVFDTFISDYDTLVLDRKLVKPGSLKAWMLRRADIFGARVPTLSFLDTKAQVGTFHDLFGVPAEKFRVVYVGADDDIFTCKPVPPHKDILVHFHGTFIPLQGIETIIRAAKRLEMHKNIRIRLVGKGQTYDSCRALANELDVKNIIWDEAMGVQLVAAKIAESDICLGIFGDSDKSLRVVPHKAFETIASCRPLITSDSQGHREVFTNGTDAVLVPPANPAALADAIAALANDAALRERITKNGYALFEKKYSIKHIGAALKGVLEEALRISGRA
jgi:glycosyltransferase involved in cell wall biosynthesis